MCLHFNSLSIVSNTIWTIVPKVAIVILIEKYFCANFCKCLTLWTWHSFLIVGIARGRTVALNAGKVSGGSGIWGGSGKSGKLKFDDDDECSLASPHLENCWTKNQPNCLYPPVLLQHNAMLLARTNFRVAGREAPAHTIIPAISFVLLCC